MANSRKIKNAPAMTELEGMLGQVQGESDRDATLIVSAWLDEDWGTTSGVALSPTRQSLTRCLGRFATRHVLVEAQDGLLSGPHLERDVERMSIIRHIRNDFAHHRHPLAFTEPSIVSQRGQLATVEILTQWIMLKFRNARDTSC